MSVCVCVCVYVCLGVPLLRPSRISLHDFPAGYRAVHTPHRIPCSDCVSWCSGGCSYPEYHAGSFGQPCS
uniref:Putative secreted protein n=1 Tax=Anopheles marajoara TaxID=58244 RepID=A0A2M4CEG5_9DIPT